jgi:O-antigen ligase/cytochrome c-type biogenesis protein CcmH/NrfG
MTGGIIARMTPVTTTLHRIVRWSIALLALIPLAPLLLQIDLNGVAAGGVLGFYFPYISTGAIAFRIIVEIAFFAWLALAVLRPEFRPDFRKPIVAIMTALTIISALAAIFGVDVVRSIWSNFERMEGLVGWMHLYALFLVVTTTIRERDDWKPFVIILWSASILNALLALSVDDGKAIDTTVDGRAAGIIGNPIYLAIHMLMSAGIVAWWVASSTSVGRRISATLVWLATTSIVLFGIAIALSGTRGTFIASAVSLLVVAGVIAFKKDSSAALRKSAIGLLVAVVAFSAFLFAVRDQQWVKENRFLERASSVFNVSGGTVSARFNNWEIALDAIRARPILGWGQDNYIYPFTYFFNPKMANEEPWFDRTHNQFLDWFVHTGFLGGIAYLALIAFAVLSVTKMKNASLVERAILVGIIAGYITHNMFVFDFLVSAMLFVMILAYISARSPRFGSAEIESNQTKVVRADVEPAAVALAVVGLCVTVWVVVVPTMSGASGMIAAISTPYVDEKQALFEEIIAERKTGYTEAVEQFVVSAIQVAGTAELPEEIRNGYIASAQQAINDEIDRVPDSVRMLMFRGALQSRLGQTDAAVSTFERMAELAPHRPNNLEMLVDAYQTRGTPDDMTKARVLAAYIYALAPDNLESVIAYARTLIVDKKVAEAEALLAPYDLYMEGKGTALFSAYQTIGRFDRVAEILERYLADKPGDTELTYSLAATYFQGGQKQKAIETLQTLLASTTDAKVRADVESLITAIRTGKNPIQ